MSEYRIKYIKSLHRPYNSRLKTTKWVCEFCNKPNTKYKRLNCSFTIQFYLYLINKLYRIYNSNIEFDNYGLPSKSIIFNVNNFFQEYSLKAQVSVVEQCTSSNQNNTEKIQKQIFSSFKAASYFITFSKNTLNLIDKKNRITELGYELLKIRNINFLKLSKKEQNFFLREVARNDLFMLMSQVYFNRYEKKYKLSKQDKEELFLRFINNQLNFIELKEFNYTKVSFDNYMKVRNKWIEELDLVGKNGLIKPSKKKYIFQYVVENNFWEFENSIMQFEKQELKQVIRYIELKRRFINTYEELLEKKTIKQYKYVNIYDIMKEMKMSFNKMQSFLDFFVKDSKYRYQLHFNNIVHSIDSRKRYLVRNSQVINIMISEV